MTLIQAIILGIFQGASEFLPISSTGHLVLVTYLFRWEFSQEEAFIFNVLVQFATLSAVIVYFRNDLINIARSMVKGITSGTLFQNENSKLGWFLFLATIPAGLVGILFKREFRLVFSSPTATAISLLITSLLLFLGELLGKRSRKFRDLSWIDALLIGLFQVLALFPGISRSGSTISGGLIKNFDRKSSARFSFLMAIPVMSAAGILALIDLIQTPSLLIQYPVYFAGFVASSIVGYIAIKWFISYLSRQSLYIFSGYCAVVGIIILILISK